MRTSLWLVIPYVAALGACQRSIEPEGKPWPHENDPTPSPIEPVVSDKREYQCGEIVVSADFHGTGPVRLRFGGKELTLPLVASGSGARYADEQGNEFWSKGDDAMFTIAGQPIRNCSSSPPPA
jgi:membrane-bound inhibitor of C-type lysozyme